MSLAPLSSSANTTIFMKQVTEVPKVVQCVQFFSRASGLTLNINKCELMPIYNCQLTEAYNIPVKLSVKYLGMHITKNIVDRKIKIYGTPLINANPN